MTFSAVFLEKVLFALFSIAIAALDIKTGMIPRAVFIAAFPVFLAVNILLTKQHPPITAIAGALLGFAVFSLAFFVSRKKLGLADVFYSGLTGLVLGPLWWYPAAAIACFTGAVYIFISGKRRIPFIPCMAFGGVSASVIQGWFF